MKLSRKAAAIYGLILLSSYVVGLNLFIYLKFLGIHELNRGESVTTILPLSTFMGIDMALAILILEFYVFPKWKHLSFLMFTLCKYLLLIVAIITSGILIYLGSEHLGNHKPIPDILKNIPRLLVSGLFISGIIYTLLFSIFFNVLKTISQYLGPKAVASALLGRYQNPAEEDLTFIFIDLKTSTTIAERLGHVQYSLFIDACFQKLTESIRAYNASVYQFVGDEAVLLWRTRDVSKTIAPVLLYFDFIDKLNRERQFFLSKFNEAPHFRAAIHAGMVAVTEIHSVKTDIVYHGDVLNTCARIMAHGSRFDKDLLVSSAIADGLKGSEAYLTTVIDHVILKGKGSATEIYEVTPR